MSWVAQFTEVLSALLLAPLLTGWVNQCRAWLQNRRAPGLLQPYRTLAKLFEKDGTWSFFRLLDAGSVLKQGDNVGFTLNAVAAPAVWRSARFTLGGVQTPRRRVPSGSRTAAARVAVRSCRG